MNSSRKSGREREVNEIVTLIRAAEIGRLMMGDLNKPMEWIDHEQYFEKPRREIQAQKAILRKRLRGEIAKFCQNNFTGVKPTDLVRLYEPLYAKRSLWRMSLIEFADRLGKPSSEVIKDTPLHATVVLSLWGLQFEYPEMHLVKDLSISYNLLIAIEDKLNRFQSTTWINAKHKREDIADLQRRAAFYRRMCVLSCFNLAEAYINGIAWEFVQTNDITSLSKTKQKILTEGQASILDKLVKIPQIVTNKPIGPLNKENEPLVTFKDTIKPFRDSIVHASPFATPERFGGYEKLTKVYELNYRTVKQTVDMTLEIIGLIYKFVTGQDGLPDWIPERNNKGKFLIPNA